MRRDKMIGSGHFNAWGERGGRTASMKLASRPDVLWEGSGHREAKKIQTFTMRASTHARDQAPSFDAPGGLIRRAVADVWPSYLYCAAKIGRRKFGFGAPKKNCVGAKCRALVTAIIQHAKQILSRIPQMTKYCVMRECENIQSWILFVSDLVFSHQGEIYGFKFPNRFLEISSRDLTLFSTLIILRLITKHLFDFMLRIPTLDTAHALPSIFQAVRYPLKNDARTQGGGGKSHDYTQYR
jgi:hypothetical protein